MCQGWDGTALGWPTGGECPPPLTTDSCSGGAWRRCQPLTRAAVAARVAAVAARSLYGGEARAGPGGPAKTLTRGPALCFRLRAQSH